METDSYMSCYLFEWSWCTCCPGRCSLRYRVCAVEHFEFWIIELHLLQRLSSGGGDPWEGRGSSDVRHRAVDVADILGPMSGGSTCQRANVTIGYGRGSQSPWEYAVVLKWKLEVPRRHGQVHGTVSPTWRTIISSLLTIICYQCFTAKAWWIISTSW
jgi:hypothetical protein